MQVVRLKFNQLLVNSVHIGHPISQSVSTSTWFVYGVRYSVLLLSLSKVVFFWKKACLSLNKLSSRFGSVLMVNLEPSLNYLMHKISDLTQQPLVLDKWRGGLLTNWKFVFLRKLPLFKKGDFKGTWSEGFMKNMKVSTRLPTAMLTFNLLSNCTPFNEAQAVGLPIFALSDSNIDTNGFLYPLPANDDAVSSIAFCSFILAKVILLGRLTAVSNYLTFKDSDNDNE